MRLPTGIPGFDDMIQGGLPAGTSVVLQGPSGEEKLRFALMFLAEGLKAGGSGLVVVSAATPDDIVSSLRYLGVEIEAVLDQNRLRVVDWYTHRSETVHDVEERGHVFRSSVDLTNVGVALSRAVGSLIEGRERRAVVELLSPAASTYGVKQTFGIAQALKARLSRFGFTSLFLVEKEMHSTSELSTLHQPFDGIVDLERQREGDRINLKIGVLHLKDTTPDPTFRIVEESPQGLRIVGVPVAPGEPSHSARDAAPGSCPLCRSVIPEETLQCPDCGARILGGVEGASSESPAPPAREDRLTPETASTPRPTPGPASAPRPVPRRRTSHRPSSGAGKGLTNGLVRARPVRGGPPKGPSSGRTNGLTNGLRGRTNGLTNGVGRTNGLTNGMGHTNGLTNGRGHTNGVTNGLVALRRGLTNGLTNGNGFTNGLGAPRLRREASLRRWKLYLVPLVASSLLLVSLFLPPDFGDAAPIQIDGDFTDWPSSATVPQGSSAGVDPNVDIQRFGTVDNIDHLAFFTEVQGVAFAGGGVPPRYDVLRIFLDVDRDAGTGYLLAGIGADRLVTVSGWGNRVNMTTLHEWDVNRGTRDWNGWIKSTSIPAATAGPRVELQIDWNSISSQHGPFYAYAHFQSNDGTLDTSDFVLSSGGSSLLVDVVPTVPEVLSGMDVGLLELDLRSHVASSTYTALRVAFLGTATTSAVTALRLVDGSGGLIQEQIPSAREVSFSFPPRTVEVGQSETLRLRGDIAGTSGDTLGLTIADSSAIELVRGVATVRPRPSPRAAGYVGVVPSVSIVDGGFSEWTNVSTDPVDGSRRADVDLRGYGMLREGSALFLHWAGGGHAFEGVVVPEANWVAERPFVPGRIDSDRDTVPDSDDSMPFDFNNNGIDDVATNGDYDEDAILDYPFGPDAYLNTTIPASFPPAYRDRPISLYVGPNNRPVLVGEDVVRAYLDTDNSAATGFRTNILGAEYLVEIRGQEGVITYRALSRFTGSSQLDWAWTPISAPPAATDYARVEAAVSTGGLGFGNLSTAFFEVMDWSMQKDSSVDAVMRIGAEGIASAPRAPAMVGPSSFPGPEPLDIAGNERWFFTNTAADETLCTTNRDASTTAGAAATSATLTAGQTICWFSPASVPDTVAGPWEVILDIEKVADATSVLRPSGLGAVNDWTVGGGGGCSTEAQEEKCVDDDGDGDSTFVASGSSSTTDSLYALDDFATPLLLAVIEVRVESSCTKTAAGTVSVAILLRSGGTNYVGSSGGQDCPQGTYVAWSDAWTTDPFDGLGWTDADLDALEAGVRDGDAATTAVRVSHVKVTVTFEPVYAVEVARCSNAGCTIATTLYGPVNSVTFGADVPFTSGSIAAQTLTGQEHIQWRVAKDATGGSVRIRYNGPYPASDDSRGTVPVPEFAEVAIPLTGTLLIIAAWGAVARRRSRSRRPIAELSRPD